MTFHATETGVTSCSGQLAYKQHTKISYKTFFKHYSVLRLQLTFGGWFIKQNSHHVFIFLVINLYAEVLL